MVNEDGVLRVGGRVWKSSMEYRAKFPVVLPSKDVVIERIMWFVHKEDGHQGLEHTHTQLHLKWWIIRGKQQVKSVMSKCMVCKRLKSKAGSLVVSSAEECYLKIGLLFESGKTDCNATANKVPSHFTSF